MHLRIRWGWLVLVMILVSSFAAAAPTAAAGSGYHLLKKVTIGGDGFWDYLGLDQANRRLYLSHSTHVVVLDADSLAQVGDIPNTQGVHGIAIAPESGRGFISCGGTSTVTVFDLKTLKTLGEVKTGEGPDGIIYDPASQRVFAFDGRAKEATAIDAGSMAVAANIPLPGRPEFAAADGRGRVYVNLEDQSKVAVIDSKALKIDAVWPMAPCESPSGMAIDPVHHRIFSGCHNKLMAVIDTDTGKVVATPAIGQGVDANRFDPGTQLAFSSNGDGTLTVIHEDSPDSYTVVDNVQTQRGARTMELDPKTHRVFLVTAEFGPAPAPTAEHPRPRPSIVPGSFTLLEFGQ